MEHINYTSENERTFAMLCHLSALAGCIIPLGHILGPLIVWLIKKDEFPEVDRQGKAALNFQLSVTIYGLIAGVLVILLVGFVLLAILAVFTLVLVIVASVKTANAEKFEYPLTITFLR
ncbi:MAG TPA: DUF4870 domain-containing protein [Tenuifilaceae bacterium]|nr:DUF4870 domain-containing protein [Tenuifilaceae bacterium]